MKWITALTALILSNTFVAAQSYQTALGMRLGTDWGITARQRLAKRSTLEGILQSSLQREEILLTALYERHFPIISRRFNLYYGGGLHKGWISLDPENESGAPSYDPFGITLVGGIEFTLARLNFSYDLKPAINFRGGAKRIYAQSGVSIRYVLVKKQKKRRKKSKK